MCGAFVPFISKATAIKPSCFMMILITNASANATAAVFLWNFFFFVFSLFCPSFDVVDIVAVVAVGVVLCESDFPRKFI